METMNEADRERFLATLRADDSFRATVRREILTEEVLHLPGAVATLIDAVVEQRRDFTALAQSMARFMDQAITALQQGFAATAEGFAGMRTDMDAGFTAMDAGFTAVDAKFDQVDADLRDIKAELAGFRADIDAVERRSPPAPGAGQE